MSLGLARRRSCEPPSATPSRTYVLLRTRPWRYFHWMRPLSYHSSTAYLAVPQWRGAAPASSCLSKGQRLSVVTRRSLTSLSQVCGTRLFA